MIRGGERKGQDENKILQKGGKKGKKNEKETAHNGHLSQQQQPSLFLKDISCQGGKGEKKKGEVKKGPQGERGRKMGNMGPPRIICPDQLPSLKKAEKKKRGRKKGVRAVRFQTGKKRG